MPLKQTELPARRPLKRREALAALAGAGLLGWAALRFGPGLIEPDLSFQPISDLPPFRELVSTGGISVAHVALAGLYDGTEAEAIALNRRIAEVRADPRAALFGPQPDAPGTVPVAIFSDVNCPYCRVLEGHLDEIAVGDPAGLRLARHELPLLGGASVVASRAVLAAERQGARDEMLQRLMRARLVTNEGYVRALAESLDLHADRLIADMNAPWIDDALLTSDAVARVFGFVGTPSMVIGRTVVTGAIPRRRIERLLEDERRADEAF